MDIKTKAIKLGIIFDSREKLGDKLKISTDNVMTQILLPKRLLFGWILD